MDSTLPRPFPTAGTWPMEKVPLRLHAVEHVMLPTKLCDHLSELSRRVLHGQCAEQELRLYKTLVGILVQELGGIVEVPRELWNDAAEGEQTITVEVDQKGTVRILA